MASIKEYNDKLQSLKNTQKMTKTMQMVSASKLRKAQEAQRNGKPYATYVRDMISRLAASVGVYRRTGLECDYDRRQPE